MLENHANLSLEKKGLTRQANAYGEKVSRLDRFSHEASRAEKLIGFPSRRKKKKLLLVAGEEQPPTSGKGFAEHGEKEKAAMEIDYASLCVKDSNHSRGSGGSVDDAP